MPMRMAPCTARQQRHTESNRRDYRFNQSRQVTGVLMIEQAWRQRARGVERLLPPESQEFRRGKCSDAEA